MFVPLEPNLTNGSAEITTQVRCDVACGNYPLAMHISNLVAASALDPGSFVQINESYSASSNSTVVVAGGQPVTQLDVSLRRESSIETPAPVRIPNLIKPNCVDGVSLEPVTRRDDEHRSMVGPHRPRSPRKPLLPEYPHDKNGLKPPFRSGTQGTISHSAAPIDTNLPKIDPSVTSPSERIATYRTYAQSTDAIPAPTAVTWNQGLVETSRRRDWLWPKVVDELIGRQWTSINQLGRSALGNSRDETRRFMVTSVNRGEGRTTIALALARWAAMTGHRTLLVDADLKRPGVTTALHIQSAGDWRTASLGFEVENNIVSCRSLPVSLLPLSLNTNFETGPATLEQLIMQLAVAEQEFDCCVIDAGPIDELCQHIATVTRLASSIVVVNTHDSGVSPHLISACNTLWQMGKPAVAIADNFHR